MALPEVLSVQKISGLSKPCGKFSSVAMLLIRYGYYMFYRLFINKANHGAYKAHMTQVDGENSRLRALIGKTTSLLSVILQI